MLFVYPIVGCGQRAETRPAPSVQDPAPVTQAAPAEINAPPTAESSVAPKQQTLDDLPLEITSLPVDKPGGDESQTTREELARKRADLDNSVWRLEVLAQEHEQALVRLWDALHAQKRQPDGDAYAVFEKIDFDTLRIATPANTKQLDHGIELRGFAEPVNTLAHHDWSTFLQRFREDGYRLVQSEWHHARFDDDVDGQAQSTVAMVLYLVRDESNERLVLSGNLVIRWRAERDSDGIPLPQQIDATDLKLMSCDRPVAYREILTIDHAKPSMRSGVQPLIVYDLNRDGLSEIILGGSNEVFWNEGQGRFRRDPLLTHPEKIFEVGLIADLTGDQMLDFVAPGLRGDLLLFTGDKQGRFTSAPIGKARSGGPLQQPQVITAGDIDKDGDLDLWIGQYKISYVQGQMPSPYFDANDGFPAFLLLNDGKGRFSPATEEAGLAEKRYRRSYGGSFIDLDDDSDLDLLVVSDFAGIDAYYNDGTGYFTDVTDKIVDERHLFGMATSFADYNNDGLLDFFVTGMASTTARRLDYMKLGRKDRPEIHMMRSRMGYGNRMYLADGDRFVEPDFSDQVARTGWTWGTTSLDFDNDGDKDIFVANGHSSGESTKDHCSHFWCHDIYDASSKPNRATHELFNEVLSGYYDRSESWDGYQKNVLLMNLGGSGFINIGFLMGVGHEYDGRAVISDDLDADGRMDLVVVEDRWNDGQVLHVYRNELENENHWIGVRLEEHPSYGSPLGCKIVVSTEGRRYIERIVSGDSIHAQHAAAVHFGLGSEDVVNSIEVSWPSGHVETRPNPAVDRYHAF